MGILSLLATKASEILSQDSFHLYAAGMPVDPNPVPFLDEPNYLYGFKVGLYPALYTISGPIALS